MDDEKLGETPDSVLAGSNVSAITPLMLTEIFDGFEDAVIVADTNRRMVYANGATERLFGYAKEALYGEETKMLYADEGDYFEQGRKRYNVVSKIGAENYRIGYRRLGGEPFLGVTTGAPMRSADGEIVGFIGVIRPARSADESLDTLQEIHNIMSDVTLAHDEKVESLLRAGLGHFGLSVAILSRIVGSEYIVENHVTLDEDLEPPARADISETYCVHTLRENKPVGFHYAGRSEIRHHPCYRNQKLESYIGTPIRVDKDVYGTLSFCSPSSTEPFCKDDYILMELLSDTFRYLLYKRASEEEVAALARTDDLTGLPNRRATHERCKVLIALSDRSDTGLTVLSIDLDHFKRINDTWGHAAGDLALATFARVASGMGRKGDFCGRTGGEEFVFVLSGATSEFGVEFGNRLRRRLAEEPVKLETGESFTLRVSIGISTLQTGDSLDRLLSRADDAMYEAKRQGRDRVCRSIS